MGRQIIPHQVIIANIQNDGILGIDILTQQKCDIRLSRNYMSVKGEKIPCLHKTKDNDPTCCRIVVKDKLVIPPRSEVITNGFAIGTLSLKENIGILEPCENFVNKTGLMLGRVMVNIDTGCVPIRILNMKNESFEIRENTVAAIYEPVISPATVEINQVQIEQNSKIDNSVPKHLEGMYERSIKGFSVAQQNKFREILIKYESVFSKNDEDMGKTKVVEHRISTGDVLPVKQYPYRVPLAKREIAEKEIQKMADRGIIEPSNSPWCSPVVLVAKKSSNDVRFCCDFRKLNSVTLKDYQNLPRIDDTLDALSGSKYYSTIDLKSGYWQVDLNKEDRPKTAFAIQGGPLWQFTQMCFGLQGASFTFIKLMDEVLRGLTFKICLVYIDDIIVFSRTFEEHMTNLELVLERLKEANLKASVKKCHFMKEKVKFLGHIVSEAGVEPDPEKVEMVKNWPVPKTVKEVRGFIGLASYYRKHCMGFAQIAKPLHDLTSKNAKFVWTEKCQKAFEKLRDLLISSPILSYPRTEGEFILDADACNDAAGAVLSQIQDGQERVLAYYSKCFSKAELSYCVTRKELLAILSAIKNFHHYLYGVPFKVRSDHGSLRFLMNFKNPQGQMARWLEFLSTYDFTIEYRMGRIHNNADALSRRPCHSHKCKHCEKAEERYEPKEEPSQKEIANMEVRENVSESVNECVENSMPSLVIDQTNDEDTIILNHLSDTVLIETADTNDIKEIKLLP